MTSCQPHSTFEPAVEKARQLRWTATLREILIARFANEPNVCVGQGVPWLPVEADNSIRAAPDFMIVFGRPKADRDLYLQWREDGIAPSVVFEVVRPGYRMPDIRKLIELFRFYQDYGVDEFYLFDPTGVVDDGALAGWIRIGGEFEMIERCRGFVSPHLKCRFELDGEELVVLCCDR